MVSVHRGAKQRMIQFMGAGGETKDDKI